MTEANARFHRLGMLVFASPKLVKANIAPQHKVIITEGHHSPMPYREFSRKGWMPAFEGITVGYWTPICVELDPAWLTRLTEGTECCSRHEKWFALLSDYW